MDNHVMIAHNCRIGKCNILCSQVGIAGSCTTGDYVMMGGQAGVADHHNVGHHVSLGAQSGVFKDIPDGESHLGTPCSPIREQAKKYSALGRLPEMRRQFREMQRRLASLLLQIEASDKINAA